MALETKLLAGKGEPPASEASGLAESSLPTRRRLPDTRESLTHKFRVGGHEGYVTVGLYEDGRPGEVFIKIAKQGSTLYGLFDTIGVLTSLCLQYRVPVETLSRKLEHVKFEPSGGTSHEAIRDADSIVDYLFRWLCFEFSSGREQ